ncbi:hypothetical protein QTP88_007379 [Uroleucon formosanum]
MIHRLSAMVCFIKPSPSPSPTPLPPPRSHTTTDANTRGGYLFSSFSLANSRSISLACISNASGRCAASSSTEFPSIHIDYDVYIRDRKRVPSGIGVENTEEKKNGRRVKNCRVEGTAIDEDTRMGARGGRPK